VLLSCVIDLSIIAFTPERVAAHKLRSVNQFTKALLAEQWSVGTCEMGPESGLQTLPSDLRPRASLLYVSSMNQVPNANGNNSYDRRLAKRHQPGGCMTLFVVSFV
jgi:hypothetical protein